MAQPHAAQAAHDPSDGADVFVPSRDLPRERILDAATVAAALVRLRRAFGLPAPGASAVRSVVTGASVPADEWPVWLAPLLPAHAVSAAHEASDAQESERDNQRQIGLDDAFEHRAALSWLQRIASTKVQVVDHPDQSLSAEELVDWAAELLACAAGKAASGPETTIFHFPRPAAQDVQVTIRDGTLVDDALGARTWGAAPLLAAELLNRRDCPRKVLELGAGTGLVGLALAARAVEETSQGAVAGASVILTDHHPTVLANLEHNTALFLSEHQGRGVEVLTLPLDWYKVYASSSGLHHATLSDAGTTSWSTSAQTLPSTPELPRHDAPPTPGTTPRGSETASQELSLPPGGFDLLVAADCVYDPAHPVWIQAVAQKFLSRSLHARLHVTSPLRETHRTEIEALLTVFPSQGPAPAADELRVLDAAVIYGQDDFGGASRAQRMNDQAGAERVYLRLEVGWVSP